MSGFQYRYFRQHLVKLQIKQEHTFVDILYLVGQSRTMRKRPTRRAADLGYAPRFLAFFVALGFSRFGGAPLPTAGLRCE